MALGPRRPSFLNTKVFLKHLFDHFSRTYSQRMEMEMSAYKIIFSLRVLKDSVDKNQNS